MPTSSGRPIDSDFVQAIQKGKTTMADVKAKLGEPASVTTSPDGVTWSYMHWEGKPAVFGQTYSKSSTKMLTIQFKGGKVSDYTFSTTGQ
jgi:hypothetical protein